MGDWGTPQSGSCVTLALAPCPNRPRPLRDSLQGAGGAESQQPIAAHMCCRTKPNCSPLSECRGGGLWLRALAQGSGTALTFGGATMPRPQDIALGGGLCGPLEGALAMGHGPWPWAPRFRPGNACCCSWWVAAEFWWAPLSPGIGWRSPATHSQHARPQNAAHSLLLHFVGGGQWSSTALWCFCFTSNFQTLTRSASARPKSTLVRVSCAYCPAATHKGCHVRRCI
jgi:hypothetical protein